MSKIQSFKRVISEDFDPKDRDLVDKIAFVVNPFGDDVTRAFTNNLSIDDNMNWSKKDVTITTNSAGNPVGTITIKTGLDHLCDGTQVIKVTNNTSSNTYPSGMPLISFTENTNGVITINNITNLPVSSTLSLRIILF